jgi:hypothetical protein
VKSTPGPRQLDHKVDSRASVVAKIVALDPLGFSLGLPSNVPPRGSSRSLHLLDLQVIALKVAGKNVIQNSYLRFLPTSRKHAEIR